MLTKIYWLHQYDNSAKLGIMARPRGNDWLDEEITNIKKQGVELLVSLLEPNEVLELGLRQEQQLCSKHNITYINFPIVDRGIPKRNDDTDTLINHLLNKINTGSTTVIHCRMGIGRSSIIAGALLLKTGQNAKDIFAHISKIRGLTVPDTDEQTKWLEYRKAS